MRLGFDRQRRLLHAGYVALVLLLSAAAAAAAADSDREAAVRAAFLYRLAFFVNWPDPQFAPADQPLRFCILGDDVATVAERLASQTSGRRVHGREINVAGALQADCHIVYLQGEPDPALAFPPQALLVVDSLAALRQRGALALVSEPQPGGEVRLAFVSLRERLHNTPFNLSAKLLQLVRFDEVGP